MTKVKAKRLDIATLAKDKRLDKDPITPDEVEELLAFRRSLPIINPEAVKICNRKGVLCEVVGLRGTVRKIGFAWHDGACYFDGNRLGKRKQAIVMAMYGSHDEETEGNPQKVWRKMWKQGLL